MSWICYGTYALVGSMIILMLDSASSTQHVQTSTWSSARLWNAGYGKQSPPEYPSHWQVVVHRLLQQTRQGLEISTMLTTGSMGSVRGTENVVSPMRDLIKVAKQLFLLSSNVRSAIKNASPNCYLSGNNQQFSCSVYKVWRRHRSHGNSSGTHEIVQLIWFVYEPYLAYTIKGPTHPGLKPHTTNEVLVTAHPFNYRGVVDEASEETSPTRWNTL